MSTTGDTGGETGGGGKENEKSEQPSGAAASPAPTSKAKAREKDEKRIERGPGELSAPRAALSGREQGPARSSRCEKEKDRTGRRQKKPSAGGASTPNGGRSSRGAAGEKSKNEAPKAAFKFTTPPGETELSSLPLDKDLAATAKLMEEYKVAITQVYHSLCLMARRGNGTAEDAAMSSEKGNAMVEKLAKDVHQAQHFWGVSKELQPQLNISISANTEQLAEIERHMQLRMPFHLQRMKKFINVHWLDWVALKKSMAKAVGKKSANKEDIQKQMRTYVTNHYTNAKTVHLAEVQCCLAELSIYHRYTGMGWYQITQRKQVKSLNLLPGELHELAQFMKPGTAKLLEKTKK